MGQAIAMAVESGQMPRIQPVTETAGLLQSLARCLQRTNGAVCRGSLDFAVDRAVCRACGREYPVHRGVPVLRQEIDADALEWYDEMYCGRSRLKDIATVYLRSYRDRVTELTAVYQLTGPSLDIGCGTGLFADTVSGYVGLEYSPAALFAEGFEGHARIVGDARDLPFDDGSFELVISFNAIEHIDDVDKVYCEMHRVLRPGGMIIIKPAWHCKKYTTERIPIRPYHQLNLRQKMVKFLLPVIRSKPYKLLTWIPSRTWRRLTARHENSLKWTRFTPYFGPDWIEDADACSGIDIHETILFFETRGYTSQSHTNLFGKLTAGHDLLVMTKGRRYTPQ